jgi:signal transduction histidine kinase
MAHKASKLLLIITGIWLICFNTYAQLNIDTISTAQQLGDNLWLLEDSSAKLKIEDVLNRSDFKRADSEAPNYNSTKSAIWGKIPIISDQTIKGRYYFQFQYPILDSIQVWELDEDNKVLDYKITGSSFLFEQRELNTALPSFEIDKHTKTIFFRVKSPLNLNIPTVIIEHDEFINSINNRDFAQGMYAGFMIFLIIVILFLALKLNDKTFWAYIGHLIGTAFITLHLGGYAFKYAWPHIPIINTYEPLIFGLGIFSTLFSMAFLNTVESSPTLNKWLLVSVFFNLLVFPLSLLGFQDIANQLVQAVGALGCFLMLVAGIILYMKGYKPARFFVAAWSLFLIGVIISILQRVSVLPFNDFTLHASQIGSTVEAILLTFALADKVILIKEEKEQAQTNLLKESRKNAEAEKTRKLELEAEVKIRTKELETSNTNLSELNNRQHKLIRIIGHDIKGPIGNMALALQIMLEDKDNFDLSLLEKIKSTADASHILLNDLLLWASTNSEIKTEEINLKELVYNVCKVLELNALHKQINFVYKGFNNHDFIINGKKRYVETCLRNVLSNAIKFSNQNSQITILLKDFSDCIELIIEDKGVGVPKDKIEEFNSGKKLNSSLGTQGERGTGFGLEFVRDFMAAQKGKVILKSESGHGTAVILQFTKA